MPHINLSQQWIIVSCILVEDVVFYKDYLELLHIKACIHLNGALIYNLYYTALFLISSGFGSIFLSVFLCCIILLFLLLFQWFILKLLLFFVLVNDGLVYFFSLLFALVEIIWVSANYEDAKVNCVETHIDMKQEFLRDTRDANWGPSLSSIFHWWVCKNIIHQNLDVMRLHLGNLFWICKNANWIQSWNKHSTSKWFW